MNQQQYERGLRWLNLHHDGMTYPQIAEQEGVHRETVYRICTAVRQMLLEQVGIPKLPKEEARPAWSIPSDKLRLEAKLGAEEIQRNLKLGIRRVKGGVK